jgi:MoaA/NifB/PqqE/SkfB family radical SAM enzyme
MQILYFYLTYKSSIFSRFSILFFYNYYRIFLLKSGYINIGMIEFSNIKNVHLELSSFCNARCPGCPRNFGGFPFNGGYPETNLTLEQTKKIFTPEFLKQLNHIQISGNFGDMVMNPETLEIVEYFLSVKPHLYILCSTNGSARDREFWESLGRLKITVEFCLDGLEDTHHLYRQNTSWRQIIKNADIFLKSGGKAIWKMTVFSHNKHQIEDCKQLAEQHGFQFITRASYTSNLPTYDKEGTLLHVVDNFDNEDHTKTLENFKYKIKNNILLWDAELLISPKEKIICDTRRYRGIFVAANGEVYPCCYTGSFPKTYGKNLWHEKVNRQVAELATENNAVEYPISHTIKWFNKIEQAWSKKTYSQGRMMICDKYCGKDV